MLLFHNNSMSNRHKYYDEIEKERFMKYMKRKKKMKEIKGKLDK